MKKVKASKTVTDLSGNVLSDKSDNVYKDTKCNLIYIPTFFAQASAPTKGMKKGDRWTDISNLNSIKEYWYDGTTWQNYK
jgi:hypothetical protein